MNFDINYVEHYYRTKFKNLDLIKLVQKKLDVDNPKSVSVGVVGSDARLENGLVSPVECAVIFENSNDSPLITIDDSIKQKVYRKFDKIDLSKDVPFYTRLTEDVTIFSPARLFDYCHIKGDPLYYKKRLELAKEILVSSKGKRILNKANTLTNNYLTILESGMQKYKGELLVHYDLNKGITTYDALSLRGFQGTNRTLQFASSRDLAKLVRDDKLSVHELRVMPRNMVDKLNYIQDNNLSSLSIIEKNDLADNYMYFSWLYHKSQDECVKGNKVMTFDIIEVTERLKSLKRIYDGHSYFVKTKN